MQTVLESLTDLQDLLAKAMNTVKINLKTELLKHPTRMDLKKTARNTLSNERIMHRSRSLMAEIRKTIREQATPSDEERAAKKAEYDKITNQRMYNFEIVDLTKVPKTSSGDLKGSITLRNTGSEEIKNELSNQNIWLLASFIPKIGESSIFTPDEASGSTFMEWCFGVGDLTGIKYYENFTVDIDFSDIDNAGKAVGVGNLRPGDYFIKFDLIKGYVTGSVCEDKNRRIGVRFSDDSIEFGKKKDEYSNFTV